MRLLASQRIKRDDAVRKASPPGMTDQDIHAAGAAVSFNEEQKG